MVYVRMLIFGMTTFRPLFGRLIEHDEQVGPKKNTDGNENNNNKMEMYELNSINFDFKNYR